MHKDNYIPEESYLDLLKKCLTRYIFGEKYQPLNYARGSLRRMLCGLLNKFLSLRQLELVRRSVFVPEIRAEGRGEWPSEAETMIGLKRLDNLQYCITDVFRKGIPGDLIETGVWRGGATIFMRAMLKVYGDINRIVWVADSFTGLPKPNPKLYPVDEGDSHWTYPTLTVSLEEVKSNFAKYGLLDNQVRFLVGWFKDTLPVAPIERLAVLRLDGDMYESTMDALRCLYQKLSIGGYIIIDDYLDLPHCKAAVDDYRAEHNITEKIEHVDWSNVFWRRLR